MAAAPAPMAAVAALAPLHAHVRLAGPPIMTPPPAPVPVPTPSPGGSGARAGSHPHPGGSGARAGSVGASANGFSRRCPRRRPRCERPPRLTQSNSSGAASSPRLHHPPALAAGTIAGPPAGRLAAPPAAPAYRGCSAQGAMVVFVAFLGGVLWQRYAPPPHPPRSWSRRKSPPARRSPSSRWPGPTEIVVVEPAPRERPEPASPRPRSRPRDRANRRRRSRQQRAWHGTLTFAHPALSPAHDPGRIARSRRLPPHVVRCLQQRHQAQAHRTGSGASAIREGRLRPGLDLRPRPVRPVESYCAWTTAASAWTSPAAASTSLAVTRSSCRRPAPPAPRRARSRWSFLSSSSATS